MSPCPSLRFGFVQDKYSASAFNFPAENKPQYIHVTGEALWAKCGQAGPCGGSVSPRRGLAPGFFPRTKPVATETPQPSAGTSSVAVTRFLLSWQEQCSCSCPTPSASSPGSSGGGETPPAPPTRTCSARSGWATTGPTTPC